MMQPSPFPIHSNGHHEHLSPTMRLRRLLGEERRDLLALVAYTLITSVLSLAVPLAAQALVNTIAQGVFLQPLVVLTVLLLIFMLGAGALKVVQLSLVETLQQRVFARIALRLSESLPRIKGGNLSNSNVPELVNRFFDVIVVQKALAKLLLDGLTVALAALGGLVLMAFYSWWLLAFDIVVVLCTIFILVNLGRGGLSTSIRESINKYRVAEWLEETARCHRSLKVNGSTAFSAVRADQLVTTYIKSRSLHFSVLFRQAIGNYTFQALAISGVLAIGGLLVIQGDLSLGQLVAAELVVVGVLASIDKLIQKAGDVYDLLTGLDKVGHVLDLPVERVGGITIPESNLGAAIRVRDVSFSYEPGRTALSGLNLSLSPGDRVGVVGASGAGKSTLAAILCSLEQPSNGSVQIDGIDLHEVDLGSLRQAVAVIDDDDELFSGTIEDNIVAGRSGITREDIRWALDLAQMTQEIDTLPNGLQFNVVSGGRNLSRGQRQRLLIARAVADHPRLLILDEAFTGIEEVTRQRILDSIFAKTNTWTILSITHIDEVVVRNDVVHVMDDGRITESGPTRELANNKDSEFARLFPFLCRSDQQPWPVEG